MKGMASKYVARRLAVEVVCLSVEAAAMFVLVGCEQKPQRRTDKETAATTKTQIAEHLRNVEKHPELMRCLPLCRDMLERLDRYGSLAVTEVPDPYLVRVVEDQNRGKTAIFIRYVERNSDLLGIRVREYWLDGHTVSEVYELDMGSRALLPECTSDKHRGEWSWCWAFSFTVTERTNPSVRKEAELWQTWVKDGGPEEQPSLYIAKPTSTTHVLISLIDEKGHESRAVPLDSWVVYGKNGNPVRQIGD
ncbi:MAG: hypothetical protein ACYSTF_08115 [Planctomycetota bacterium]|jgi:hypothetical protein